MKMKSGRKPTYKTNDLPLAAALVVIGHELVALDRSNKPRVAFLFEQDELINTTIHKYWSDQLQVNPKNYFDVLKHLKSRIYSG